MERSLEGRVAIVTGGGSGIGRATSLAFAAEGAKVVIADVDQAGGLETKRLIGDAGGEAIVVLTDVAQAASVKAMVDAAVGAYGRLDCAFNNAGINGTSGATTADYEEEMWDRVIGINLKGVWLSMKYEIPKMLEQGAGAIVNTSSIAGLVGRGSAAYTASKHGVTGLTRRAALEYAKSGIRVNCVCPALVYTPMTAPVVADKAAEAASLAMIPMGRGGSPEEIARVVVWLCSPAASFVTGHAMSVDGGVVAQ